MADASSPSRNTRSSRKKADNADQQEEVPEIAIQWKNKKKLTILEELFAIITLGA